MLIEETSNIVSFFVHTINGGSMKKYYIFLLSLLLVISSPVLAYSNYIIPGGENIGINVSSDGILVIGFYKINGKYNQNKIKVGDYIIKVNNNEVNDINDLINEIEDNNSEDIKLTIRRNNKEIETNFKLVNQDGIYKTGLYVKDSLTGIGTLTYIDPNTKIYGALGHEIEESTSRVKLEIKDGTIFKSIVTNIDRSSNGKPGTKNAKLITNNEYGNIHENTINGIYGSITKDINKETLEVGKKEDLKLGEASIYTVLNNEEVKEYKINITKIDLKHKIKNIYFEITDEELINLTGGIVQGMSGSPIIQDNKIYGAITHVVVDNVKTGYGIFITTMLEEGEN